MSNSNLSDIMFAENRHKKINKYKIYDKAAAYTGTNLHRYKFCVTQGRQFSLYRRCYTKLSRQEMRLYKGAFSSDIVL